MDEPTIEEWMDRHHVEIVRTHATNMDGIALGKYIKRPKFLKSLPGALGIADMALAMDASGLPHLAWWHDFRRGVLGDIGLKPDIDTLISDGTDPDLGHIICDFVSAEGEPISLCPRSLLKRITDEIADMGYRVTTTFELEFFLFHTSFADARRRGYQHLSPVGATENQMIYSLRNAYHSKPFMDEVIRRLNWQKIEWESWSDEGGYGQVELNFTPSDPVQAADRVSRARQIVYEVACDMDMAVTFMAHPQPGYSSGLHAHHSLTNMETGEASFHENGGPSPLMMNWIAGMIATAAGASSFLSPTINSYRRLAEFAAPPVTASWGIEDKSAMLRIITRTPSVTRIENRLAASDANPYLAQAVMLAGGLIGAKHNLQPPEPLKHLGWRLPDTVKRLPRDIMSAYEALGEDDYLAEVLGEDVIEYWRKSRRAEWLMFHTEGGDPEAREVTDWEYNRYFELI